MMKWVLQQWTNLRRSSLPHDDWGRAIFVSPDAARLYRAGAEAIECGNCHVLVPFFSSKFHTLSYPCYVCNQRCLFCEGALVAEGEG